MTHELKIAAQFADAVLEGRKNFEVRRNDRGFNAGDFVHFTVVDGSFSKPSHPLNKMTYRITYVLSGWGIKDGYVAFGIREDNE